MNEFCKLDFTKAVEHGSIKEMFLQILFGVQKKNDRFDYEKRLFSDGKTSLWQDVWIFTIFEKKSILTFTLAAWCKNNETNLRLKWRLFKIKSS